MKRLCLALLFPLLAVANPDLRIGQAAPPLSFTEVLQSPDKAPVSWESLKGNAVVLEFWATWCAGCVAQIEHLNHLVNVMDGKPVRFISVTDEEPGIVQRFLKDYPMSGWVALDADGATFKNFGILGRPRTILVDGTGAVRGIGNPSELTADILERLYKGKDLDFSAQNDGHEQLQAEPNPFFEVMIRAAAPVEVSHYSPGAISEEKGKSFRAWGVSLRKMLSWTYGIEESRIVGPSWAETTQYDVAVAAPGLTLATQNLLLKRVLEEGFQLRAHTEPRVTEVYILKKQPETAPKLVESTTRGSSGWGKPGNIHWLSAETSSIAFQAERVLNEPVLDETGIPGRFDISLQWDPKDPSTFVAAVEKQLGLKLEQAQRPLDYLVVDSATQPRTW